MKDTQKVIREEDGTRWIADTKTDTPLYKAPQNPPNTGQEYLTGTDLFVHRTKSHGLRFYKRHWSMWQGTIDSIQPIGEAEALEFLEDCVGDYFGFPQKDELALVREYLPSFMAETA